MRIAIWGTSGAGKTTLIKNLKQHPRFKHYKEVREPISENPYFERGYSPNIEISRANSYKTEIWMLAHRFQQLEANKKGKNILFDRTILDQIVFAHADYKSGRLERVDWKVFETYFSKVIIPYLKSANPFDYIIYLKVNRETAVQRRRARGLDFELNFDPTFWTQLNDSYNYYLEYMRRSFPQQFMVIWGNSNDPQLLANTLVYALEYREQKLSH